MKISIYAFRRLSDSIYDTAEFLTPQYKIYYGWQHLMRRIKGINLNFPRKDTQYLEHP